MIALGADLGSFESEGLETALAYVEDYYGRRRLEGPGLKRLGSKRPLLSVDK